MSQLQEVRVVDDGEGSSVVSDKDRRLFFKHPFSPGKVTLEGITREERSDEDAAIIPESTPSFKFFAKFEGCQAGQHVVHWRVKLLDQFTIPNGLRFSVDVSYDAELADISGSLDVALPVEELEKLVKNHSYDLQLEELVTILPHEGKATVELSLSNIESERRFEYSDFEVDFVGIRPFTGDKQGQSKHTLRQTKILTNSWLDKAHERTLPLALSNSVPMCCNT
ncbi:hypothetical protein BGZ65_003066 [Modicella reniformis]|uniref:Uncharacterized protein n=1 Tax=Modicella reniformis TaxID=1440133 RepID=A0A9P6SM88_9FUNG|nr:hypothetical protein BGZ65_003066 [Modicella reniformis]